MRHSFWRHGIINDYSPYVIMFLVTIALLAIIFYLFKSSSKKEAGLYTNEKQKDILENFEGLVCSMISQNGKGLKQYEISSNLGLPLNIVSEKLNNMQNERLIDRKWDNDDYTYIIKKTDM